MLYGNIFSVLNKNRVKYLVVGGVACVFYGVTRFTKDLDLIVDPDPNNLKKLIKAMTQIRYFSRVPVKPEEFCDIKNWEIWTREKNMKAFTFVHEKPPFEQVDIVIQGPVNYKKAVKKRQKRTIEGITVWLTDIYDLIKMKTFASRVQDKEDIADLKSILQWKRPR